MTTSLKRVRDGFLVLYPDLTEEDRSIVKTRIDALLERIDSEPKSLKWRVRAKIGTKKKWYTEVEEIIR